MIDLKTLPMSLTGRLPEFHHSRHHYTVESSKVSSNDWHEQNSKLGTAEKDVIGISPSLYAFSPLQALEPCEMLSNHEVNHALANGPKAQSNCKIPTVKMSLG